MLFRFDANQEYQVKAIEASADLFDGQPRREFGMSFKGGTLNLAAVANVLDLDEARLLANLANVQARGGLPQDIALECIEQPIETVEGNKTARFPNFSVEMETGTGKTYVYLRTLLELYRRYGWQKFIVVVPSVAIREGVLKTLKITDAHLRQLHSNPPYAYYVYDSANLSQVRQFALAAGVQVMVMTIDAFNKAANVIRQTTDKLQGETPIHLVQTARPILILDEPQNMESEARVAALATLDPLFALRYSATHRNPYNVVYRLTPAEAYRQGLVKRIEVASVVQESDANVPFLRLDAIEVRRRMFAAKIGVHKLHRDGTVKETVVSVGPGDSLEAKTNRSDYAGYEIDEINSGGQFVRFANQKEIRVGEAIGSDKKAVFQAQIRYTVETHFRRQARLKDTGLKVLSLFFIDRVDNYVQANGLIRRLFNEAFDDLKRAYPDWNNKSAEQVQAGYFAQKRRRGNVVEQLDSTGKSAEDEQAYDLIMRDKESLLTFEDPNDDEDTGRKRRVAFIFSHSALREGWDNPNVFQICTLNQTASEVKKRQEVGRGVRLAVNQAGDRVHDECVNVLTVVANESYERYVGQLQCEIEEAYGAEGVPPKPANARKRATVTLRKQYMLTPEFKDLWDRIRHKTRYAVKIDSERLLDEVVTELDKAEIKKPRITIRKAEVHVDKQGAFEALQMSGAKTVMDLAGRYPLPNLVEIMANLMEQTTPPVRLSRRTLLTVFERCANKQAAIDNPHEFATVAVRVIKERLPDHLVNGIQYERIDDWYEMTQFEDQFESWAEYLVPATNYGLYDHVVFDSEVERRFVEDMEKRTDVKLYVKLPNWFIVPTPVGAYNPDWAIVMQDCDAHGEATGRPCLYLVRETKDTTDLAKLRGDEARKIRCGRQHFGGALNVDYRVVTKASDLP